MNDDSISRKSATAHLKKRLYETQLNNDTEHPYYEEIADNRIDVWMNEVPSAQPTEARCWGCHCPKMEKLNEQKTFSEMVHLHDSETNSCNTISRQAAIEAVEKESQVDGAYGYMDTKSIVDLLNDLPSVQPEQKRGRWVIDNGCVCCSECGEPNMEWNYCPNCGAKMV